MDLEPGHLGSKSESNSYKTCYFGLDLVSSSVKCSLPLPDTGSLTNQATQRKEKQTA